MNLQKVKYYLFLIGKKRKKHKNVKKENKHGEGNVVCNKNNFKICSLGP